MSGQSRYCGGDAGVERVVVHRRDRVGQRPDDLGAARLLRDPRGGPRRVHVMRRVEHDEAVHAVAHQAPVDELDHLRVRPLPGDEPEPGPDELQRCVGHRLAGDPQQRPRVFPVRPHGHAHRGRRRVVKGPEPDPPEHGRDRGDVRGPQPGRPPQRLVPVPQRHVNQPDLSHRRPQDHDRHRDDSERKRLPRSARRLVSARRRLRPGRSRPLALPPGQGAASQRAR